MFVGLFLRSACMGPGRPAWTWMMQNGVHTLSLAQTDADTADLPGFTIQTRPGPPPDYPVGLYRIYLADESDVALTLEHQPISLKQGHLLTLSPGELVAFDEDAHVQSISFHHNFFCVRVLREEVYCDGVVFNKLTGLPIVAYPESEQVIIRAHLKELNSILNNQGPFSHDRTLNALRALLLHAADCKLRMSDLAQEPDTAPTRLSDLVLAFQTLVEETYADRKDASFYSDALGVTLATLNRRVKEELGLSVMQAVNERLAIAARAALRSGERSVKEVAFDLGFVDPLYFSRFFKKQFGSPPTRYFEESMRGGA